MERSHKNVVVIGGSYVGKVNSPEHFASAQGYRDADPANRAPHRN